MSDVALKLHRLRLDYINVPHRNVVNADMSLAFSVVSNSVHNDV